MAKVNRGRTDLSRKFCHRCKAEKPVEAFGKNRCKYDGLQAYCKPCCSAYHKAKGYITPPGHERYWKYGIPHDLCVKMLESQGYMCAICPQPLEEYGDRLTTFNLDHNHETGQIRELLCRHCNALLGQAKEDISILENAIKYLKGHKNAE